MGIGRGFRAKKAELGSSVWIVNEKDQIVAQVFSDPHMTREEQWEIACLMAAAPQALEAVEAARVIVAQWNDCLQPVYDREDGRLISGDPAEYAIGRGVMELVEDAIQAAHSSAEKEEK